MTKAELLIECVSQLRQRGVDIGLARQLINGKDRWTFTDTAGNRILSTAHLSTSHATEWFNGYAQLADKLAQIKKAANERPSGQFVYKLKELIG
jgi:hypothetical protein